MLAWKNYMNTKIFNHLSKKLNDSFNLSKWDSVRAGIAADTVILDLPWTPKRLERFTDDLANLFDVEIDLSGTVAVVTADIDDK